MNTLKELDQVIRDERRPVLVDYYTDWCLPCRILGPILDDLGEEMGDQVRIVRVNLDENPSLSEEHGVYSVPAIFLYRKGEVLWKGSGARSKEELKRIIHREAKIPES